MKINDKLKKLKNYYLNLEHPLWEKDEWHKKINDIFLKKNLKGKFTIEEYLIRTLEICYTAPRRIIRYKFEMLFFMNESEERKKLEKELKDLEEKRLDIFNKRVKERLKWYYNL